jgi:phospholipid/cholesterol/gamma-HCH transport system substrate-binding protein
MTETGKAFWLGLFVLVALGLAAWLILFVKPSVGDAKTHLTVRFSNIEKVARGTIVTFAGRQVGEVYNIKAIEDPRDAPADAYGNLFIYELTLRVDSSVRVFVYDEVVFATAGLLGEKSIAIIPKAPPPGAPPAYEVTQDILYARSTDQLQQTLNQLTNVASTFQDTLEAMNSFLEDNGEDFNVALKSLTKAATRFESLVGYGNDIDFLSSATAALKRADAFFTAAHESQLVERLGGTFDSLSELADLFSRGPGTLSRLANSDCLYVQLTTVLCQLKTVLHDIKNYGLLYQFDRKWQRIHDLRRSCTEMPEQSYCN